MTWPKSFRSGLSLVCILFLCTGLALGTNFLLTSPLLGDDSAPPIKSPPPFKLAMLAKNVTPDTNASAITPQPPPQASPLPAYIGTYVGKVRNGPNPNMDPCSVTFDNIPAAVKHDPNDDPPPPDGRYHFADSNKPGSPGTTGVIRVQDFDRSQRKITGIWIDEYGQGPIVLTFNEDYSGYRGLWGERYGELPKHPLNGRRL